MVLLYYKGLASQELLYNVKENNLMCKRCIIIKWINIFMDIYFNGIEKRLFCVDIEREHMKLFSTYETEQEQDQIMPLSVI